MEASSVFDQYIQYGFAGFCFILCGFIFWLVRRMMAILEKTTAVIQEHTSVMQQYNITMQNLTVSVQELTKQCSKCLIVLLALFFIGCASTTRYIRLDVIEGSASYSTLTQSVSVESGTVHFWKYVTKDDYANCPE